MAADLPDLLVPDAAAWRAWLLAHHGDPSGVRLVLAKKAALAAGTSPTTLTYQEALLEALCFGWIDGQVNGRDDVSSYQRFVPRRARSIWSARNVGFVAELLEDGRMHPAGLAEVERAKADGRWDAAYAGSATIEVPDELATALAASPRATAAFGRLTSQNRYAILFRLANLKTAAAHTRNVAKFVEMLERGETAHPQKQPLHDDYG